MDEGILHVAIGFKAALVGQGVELPALGGGAATGAGGEEERDSEVVGEGGVLLEVEEEEEGISGPLGPGVSSDDGAGGEGASRGRVVVVTVPGFDD